MEIKIWDKKSAINNVSLEKLLSYRYDLKSAIETGEEIFLISNGTPRIENILFEYDIRSKYNLGMDITSEQVAQKYLKIKQQEEQKQQEEIENKLTQQEEIEQIKQENASINYILIKNDLL